ncbi:hypothetical protein [Bradyrhizobium sp. HKCCYLS20291]|uniref:hypothetical protein n=1 Tax=Bradyrhizobium sp. HKCCYLS20291 TaxID=3420766 RepID=UPI003EBE8032
MISINTQLFSFFQHLYKRLLRAWRGGDASTSAVIPGKLGQRDSVGRAPTRDP